MEQQIYMLIVSLLLIALFFYIRWKMKNRKYPRITAKYIAANLVHYQGKDYTIDISKMSWDKDVFIQYYNGYTNRIVLAYVKGIGFILTDDKSKPKYYFEDEIYLTNLDEELTGYLDSDIFYALNR